MEAKRLGVRLKKLRKEKGVGLKTVAASLRIDPAHLSRIESGKICPSEDLLDRLIKHLKGDSEELAALAGRLPKDVERILNGNPKAVFNLLRSAGPIFGRHSITEEQLSLYSDNGPKYRLVDLFCGAGGFTLGFTQTERFISVFANDFNQDAVDTFNYNFGDHCVSGDINAFLESSNVLPDADVVIGGPPCQGFSLLNRKRAGDPRKELWRAYMEVVRRTRPRIFVMENVPELLSSMEFTEIKRMAEAEGYVLDQGVLNAADYGVPQRRKRAIVIGSRIGKVGVPRPTHGNFLDKTKAYKCGLLPWETVRRHIGDLPKPFGTEVRTDVGFPSDLHFGRTPTPESVERYKAVPPGGNRFDLHRNRPELTPGCWKRKKSGGTDLFGRLWWDRPSVTIRTEFFKPEKGRYLHPEQHRPITHREAARLQSFPDDFHFQGSKIEIARQIGNAVPPLLAKRIAEGVVTALDASVARPASSAVVV